MIVIIVAAIIVFDNVRHLGHILQILKSTLLGERIVIQNFMKHLLNGEVYTMNAIKLAREYCWSSCALRDYVI